MKLLRDIQPLLGQVETIPVRCLNAHWGEVLAQVKLGKTFVVSRHKTPVAVICGPIRSDDFPKVPGFDDLLERLRRVENVLGIEGLPSRQSGEGPSQQHERGT